jgi:hypothetical protein
VNLGIFTNYAGSSNFYIADSYFKGRDDPKHLFGWNGNFWAQFNGVEGQVFPPILASYTAVRLYGPGHVVAYNYVTDFHDGIDMELMGIRRLACHRWTSLPVERVLGQTSGGDRFHNNYRRTFTTMPSRSMAACTMSA